MNKALNAQIRDAYLELLKKTVVNWIYGQNEVPPMSPMARVFGSDWPPYAHSMSGFTRLSALQEALVTVFEKKVPGDIIECGVWRGGSCIFMRGVMKAYGEKKRKILVADSFEGLPKAERQIDADRFANKSWKTMSVSYPDVVNNFKSYDLLDNQVQFVKGWFKDTLPKLKNKFALIRLDGTMYDSTYDALEALYPRLSPGGFLFLDDYYVLHTSREAVDDYRAKHSITEEIQKTDWCGAHWQKSPAKRR